MINQLTHDGPFQGLDICVGDVAHEDVHGSVGIVDGTKPREEGHHRHPDDAHATDRLFTHAIDKLEPPIAS